MMATGVVGASRSRLMTIAVLHPGEMGAAVAAALRETVIWAPEGRSAATAERARADG